MPWLASVILGGLIELMGSLIGRALLALGFGFVEYTGFQALLGQVTSAVSSSTSAFAGGAAGEMMQWAGFLKLDVDLSILVSAVGIKLIFRALSGNTVRKLVQTGA